MLSLGNLRRDAVYSKLAGRSLGLIQALNRHPVPDDANEVLPFSSANR